MTVALSPKRWAFDLTHLLNAVMGENRFPVKVKELALDYSRQRFPDDPIAVVRGDALPGFDGALFKAPVGKKGWGIFYNAAKRQMWACGCRMPTQMASGRSRCFCGAEIDVTGTSNHVYAAHLEMR